MTAYSPSKIFHHRDKIDQLKKHEQPTPVQVHFIISDLCNQDCSFCAYRMSGYTSNQLFSIKHPESGKVNNNPNRMIPYDKAIEILDDCKEMDVKAIQITGGGEPSVHPQHQEIYQAVLDRGMELALVSNGVIFKEKTIDLLLQATWVRFSIDAGNEDTYSSIRNISKSHYAKMWNNVKSLAAAKKSRGGKVTIGLGFVVTQENWKEIDGFAKEAKDSGVDNIRISAVFQNENEKYFDNFFDKAAELCRMTKEKYEDNEFTVFNNFGERYSDLLQQSPDYSFCGYQNLVTYIGGDLNLYRCCNTAYNFKGLIGSIADKRFKDLWFSQEKKNNFDCFDAKTCERCMFNNKNKAILYAVNNNPEHVNFV
tara:strand:- start:341 stop:1441 length:1101 start_codon:yes stop_codon:yes gene_type:complete